MASKPDDAPMLALIDTPDIAAPTVADQARIVLLNDGEFDAFYAKMKAETDKHVPDVSTDKGRKAVIALARRVTTTKTAITAAAKGLTEQWRAQTAQVNAARRPIEERLAGLAEEVRRPVTEWEAAEAARVERNLVTIKRIGAASIVTPEDTAASVTERGRAIWAEELGEGWTDEEAASWQAAKELTVKTLVAARDRLTQEEADRAELLRLREEAAERERAEEADRAAQAARDEEQRRADAAREAEERRVAEAQAAQEREAERIEQARRDADEQARREVEEAAKQAQQALADAHARELAEAQAERDRLAEQARVEAQQREQAAREDARRAANRAHVAKVMGAAKEAIMTCGVTEDQARTIVTAIKGDLIPAVTIRF